MISLCLTSRQFSANDNYSITFLFIGVVLEAWRDTLRNQAQQVTDQAQQDGSRTGIAEEGFHACEGWGGTFFEIVDRRGSHTAEWWFLGTSPFTTHASRGYHWGKSLKFHRCLDLELWRPLGWLRFLSSWVWACEGILCGSEEQRVAGGIASPRGTLSNIFLWSNVAPYILVWEIHVRTPFHQHDTSENHC